MVNSDELIISNNTPYSVYYEVFPTEMLDFIDWGPCDRPDKCADIRIEPQEAKHIYLRSFGIEAEGPPSVFWWHLADPGTELDVDYVGVQLIEVDLPPRVRMEDRQVTTSCARGCYSFPANFMLIGAIHPWACSPTLRSV